MAQQVKYLHAMKETWVQSPGWEDPLEEDIATHSSILAGKIPRTEKPGGYGPWGLKESDITEATNHTASHREFRKDILRNGYLDMNEDAESRKWQVSWHQ